MTTPVYPDTPSFAVAVIAHHKLWARIEVIMRAKPDRGFTTRELANHPDIYAVAKHPGKPEECSNVLQQMKHRKLVYRSGPQYFWRVQPDAVTQPAPTDTPAEIPDWLKKDAAGASEPSSVVAGKPLITPSPAMVHALEQVQAVLDNKPRARRLRVIDDGVEITITLGTDAKVIIDEV